MVEIGDISVEFSETVTARGVPSAAWPIGFLLGLGVLVAFSNGSSSGVGVEPPANTPMAVPTAIPPSLDRSEQFALFLPSPGDVVLGSCVPVAGRVAPPRGRSVPAAQPASVAFVILDGDRILGEGTLAITNGTFIGCLDVESPSKGRRVELFVSVAMYPTRALTHVSFILAAKSNPDH